MSTDATPAGSTDPQRPVLRIVRGEPSAEELAALTAIVAAAGGDRGVQPAPAPQRGRWNDPAHAMRASWAVGPGGWRAAGTR